MEIRSYLGVDVVNRLLDIEDGTAISTFIGEVALRVLERGYGEDIDGIALRLVCANIPPNLKRVLCDRELTIVSEAFPEYVMFYCEHPALVGAQVGLEGLRARAEDGDVIIIDMLKRMELWRKFHDLGEYLSMNVSDDTNGTAGFVVVGKLKLN